MIDFFHTFLSFYKNRPVGPVFLLYTVIFFKSFKLKHLSIFLFCVFSIIFIFKNRIGPRDQCGFFFVLNIYLPSQLTVCMTYTIS